jgi:putative peptidoglycan lipid II flippase
MVNKIFSTSKRFLTEPQNTVLSAATIIMLMVVASRVLGLIRNTILVHFFTPDTISLFFAAFRLPDTIFEVLVFGTFSSAFIPVFARTVLRNQKEAWEVARTIVNIGLIVFGFFALIIGLTAESLYTIFAPGYSAEEIKQIAEVTRVLLAAQLFFVVSYVLTGVLESLKRFLVPALAPLFYNLGIITGTVFLSDSMGLMGPSYGVLIGAFCHFLIQLPLAVKLGFRFKLHIKITEDVKKIGRLAGPRVFEVAILQISKTAELYLASLISTASYAYYYFANSIQLLPVGLFGMSIAKAALPTLASLADDTKKFKRTLFNSLNQMAFFILPLAAVLIVLRIPIVRLIYGRRLFDWESTLETGMIVSAFGFGIFFQGANALLARAFYALHDTKTPVKISVIGIILITVLDFILIREFNLPVWGLAAAFTFGSGVQTVLLYYLINRRLDKFSVGELVPIIKITFATIFSGSVMYLLLKIFDRSVWIQRLSFLGKFDGTRDLVFERFVLDTRYSFNLLILTIAVSLVGVAVYLATLILLRSKEVGVFFNLSKRIMLGKKMRPSSLKEQEPVSPVPVDPT